MTVKKLPAKVRAYLLSLDAVKSVTASRITYSESFKAECCRLYALGVPPSRIFRSAGLDPKIIGYKRIERAVSRWREAEEEGRTFKRQSSASTDEKRARIVEDIRELERRLRLKEGELAEFDSCMKGEGELMVRAG